MTYVEESRSENSFLRFHSLWFPQPFHNVFLKHFPSSNIPSALNTDLSLLLASVIVIIAISRIILQMKNIFSTEKETPYFSSSMYPSPLFSNPCGYPLLPWCSLLSSPLIASASSSIFHRELFENKEYILSEAKHDKSRIGSSFSSSWSALLFISSFFFLEPLSLRIPPSLVSLFSIFRR